MKRNTGLPQVEGCSRRTGVINNIGLVALDLKQNKSRFLLLAGTWWVIFYSKQSRQGSCFPESCTCESVGLLSAGVWSRSLAYITLSSKHDRRMVSGFPTTSKSASVQLSSSWGPVNLGEGGGVSGLRTIGVKGRAANQHHKAEPASLAQAQETTYY